MNKTKRHQSPLADALEAPRADFFSEHAGRIAYYADAEGDGRPLVLVHSINAAPSSFEMRPCSSSIEASGRSIVSICRASVTPSGVRGPIAPELYANALADFLRRVVQQPADVIALSLSAEFAARAALAMPGRIASLVVISPTGFSLRPPAEHAERRIAHKALTIPLVSQGLYDLVASRPSIRYFLGRSFVGDVPAEVIDYAHATSHQPGARHAPLTFLSMQLFTPNAMDRLYGKLTDLPVLAIADRDPYITFERPG